MICDPIFGMVFAKLAAEAHQHQVAAQAAAAQAAAFGRHHDLDVIDVEARVVEEPRALPAPEETQP
jgi:hypothetical protein